MDARIPFTRPRFFGAPRQAVEDAIARGGGSLYAERCADWLRERVGCAAVLLTPSCTAALELAALTLGLGPGDEVIMPSFAFPSLAAAVALRGARPVFVDIRRDTLGLDEALVEDAITSRTKAIFTLAYGGVGGDLPAIAATAERHGLATVEDNAHGLCATHDGRPLGSFGDLAALSFHGTKNVQVGEGGALLINEPCAVALAQTLQDKGTNRRDFLAGRTSRYEWVEVGSSPLIGEVTAALLWSQLQHADAIADERRAICAAYREAFAGLADHGLVELPQPPEGDAPDGHAFFFLANGPEERDPLIAALRAAGLEATFHYVPLHSSPAGRRCGRAHDALAVTDEVAATIVRLPVWPGLPDHVPQLAAEVIERVAPRAGVG